jgi:hypothetical protein
MAEQTSLAQAIEIRGPFAVWDLLSDDEKTEAASLLWEHADRESRSALELTLAKELKFRAKSIRKLPAERVVSRLVRMAEELPEPVLFQYLLYLHLHGRKDLLVEYLDAVGLPHNEGVLDLGDDATPPEEATLVEPASTLVAAHGHAALVYLATLKVADATFWAGLDPVLAGFDESGETLEGAAEGAAGAADDESSSKG